MTVVMMLGAAICANHNHLYSIVPTIVKRGVKLTFDYMIGVLSLVVFRRLRAIPYGLTSSKLILYICICYVGEITYSQPYCHYDYSTDVRSCEI